MGQYQQINNKKVVSYEYKSKMSDITSKLMGIQKSMWRTDRSAYNKCKEQITEFKQYKEITRHWVMMDPEVSPGKINLACAFLIQSIDYTCQYVDDHHKELLNSVKQELEALKVMVSIDEHETSFFSR